MLKINKKPIIQCKEIGFNQNDQNFKIMIHPLNTSAIDSDTPRKTSRFSSTYSLTAMSFEFSITN